MASLITRAFKVRQITPKCTHLKKYLMDTLKKENWFPGISEVECYLACDPTSLYVGELNGKAVGTAAIFKYEDKYRHGGCLIVDQAYRNQNYGSKLSQYAFRTILPQ